MNDNWQKSRPAYLAYRDAKRRLNNLNKDCDRARRRVDRDLAKYMQIHSESIYDFKHEYSNHLAKAYQAYRESKLHHQKCSDAFNKTIKDFRDKEINYSVVIFKGLRNTIGMTVDQIARVYGIWNDNIIRWIGKPRSKEMIEIYEKEYGIDKDEDDS